MAKGNMLLGTLRGSIGDVTYKRVNGEQVSYPRNKVVKNPRSEAQMVQRMITATTAQAYAAMKSICDHSFEGVSPGAKSQYHFNSLNSRLLRSALSYNPILKEFNSELSYASKGQTGFELSPYIIARGSLTPLIIDTPFRSGSFTALDEMTGSIPIIVANEAFSIDPYLRALNAQAGDWLTYCFVIEDSRYYPLESGHYQFGFIRFTVAYQTDNTSLTLVNTLNSNGAASMSLESLLDRVAYDANKFGSIMVNRIFPNLSEDGPAAIVATAAIHSRLIAGSQWLRSDAQLSIRNTSWYTDKFGLLVGWPHVTDAVESWMGAGTRLGEGKYILNGGNQ